MAFIMRGHMLPGIKQRVEEAGVCESCYCADCRCSPSPTKQVGCAKNSEGKFEGKSKDELAAEGAKFRQERDNA